METQRNIMIDIETMSTDPTAAIVSIAAVEFNPVTGQTKELFNENINLQSCIDIGLAVDASTIKWWIEQPHAQTLFHDTIPIKDALFSLSNKILESDIIWANIPSFDCAILRNAFKKTFIQCPWKFYNERDLKTIAAFFPEIKKQAKNIGTAHNALDDCLFQISYLFKMHNIIINSK